MTQHCLELLEMKVKKFQTNYSAFCCRWRAISLQETKVEVMSKLNWKLGQNYTGNKIEHIEALELTIEMKLLVVLLDISQIQTTHKSLDNSIVITHTQNLSLQTVFDSEIVLKII